MTTITVTGATLTSGLAQILAADDIEVGTQVGYALCKLLWTVHPLGGKLVEKPITLAQSGQRIINVPGPIEDDLVKAFQDEWDNLKADQHIRDAMHISRAYGAGALAYGFPDLPTDKPLDDPFELAKKAGLYFNVYDPLNLSGSIVTNQNPNAPDFQKPNREITAAGQPYHPSRTCVIFHGTPIYIDYQPSSFSFSGRSVFLRCLFALKSFLGTMKTDDMISRKAGLLIAKTKQNSSVVDEIMEKIGLLKRSLLKEAVTDEVLQVDVDDEIESLNLQNIDGAHKLARDNIIANISAGSDVPAIIIKDEAFAEGFSDGDNDMMNVVQFINGVRVQMKPLYDFFTRIVQYRAWNEAFFKTLQEKHADLLSGRNYKAWFFETRDLFEAKWPSLIQEPEGEKTERNSKKLKAVSDLFKVLAPGLDPENGARLRQWIVDAVNDMPELFTSIMEFDQEAFADNAAEMQKQLAAAAQQGTPGEPGGEEGGDDGGKD